MSFISLCAFRRRGQASLRVGRRCCHHLSSQARFLLQMHVEEGGSRSHIDWSTYQPREGLKPPSLEQKRIVEEVCKQESNVRVDAVAGSGKTTTILHLASLFNRPIVALLYNARLKEETRAKKDSLGLKHLEVHSFHAFAVKFYKAFDAKDDTGLSRLIKEDPPPDRPFSFDLFIFDEVQDMTPELFSFVCKIMRDNASPYTLLLLGDERQNIFQFKNADARYLTLAPKVFGSAPEVLNPVNDKQWERLELQTSFRLSGNIAKFMNKNLLHFDLFRAVKPIGPKVRYFRGNTYKVAERIGDELLILLNKKECTVSDIFILAPTVKLGKGDKLTPVNELANYLQREGYAYYVPSDDESKLDDKIMQNKIVFSSFHQCKGLERKVVVVFNFDKSYFDYYAKDALRTTCPNTMYVACTRAQERLYLIGESVLGGQMPYLKDIHDSEHLDVIDVGRLGKGGEEHLDKSKVAVTKLTKYLPETTMRNAMQYIRTTEVVPIGAGVKLAQSVKTSPTRYEPVYELTGLALPAVYERRTTGRPSTIQEECLRVLPAAVGESKESDKSYVMQFVKEVNTTYDGNDISGHLRLAAIYNFVTSGYMSKPVQIKSYDWVSPADGEYCIDVLKQHLVGKVKYEVEVEWTKEWPKKGGRQVTILGRIDALTTEDLWELKCTQSLDDEHLLQLAVYAWMGHTEGLTTGSQELGNLPFGRRRFRLLNMRTGQLLQLDSDYDELTMVVNVLLENYLKGDPKITEEKFLKQVNKRRLVFFPDSEVSSVAIEDSSVEIEGVDEATKATIEKAGEDEGVVLLREAVAGKPARVSRKKSADALASEEGTSGIQTAKPRARKSTKQKVVPVENSD